MESQIKFSNIVKLLDGSFIFKVLIIIMKGPKKLNKYFIDNKSYIPCYYAIEKYQGAEGQFLFNIALLTKNILFLLIWKNFNRDEERLMLMHQYNNKQLK
ncbi:unnamed protein product [Paramecium sonneborni]|uniref:Uncharacterized protein n=1 Tax=Paramecium sonneborni TaxID=65129 RepID=A0A8S1RD89_9CILI|nr:unnamed protein product [Paramecium sonneborni]